MPNKNRYPNTGRLHPTKPGARSSRIGRPSESWNGPSVLAGADQGPTDPWGNARSVDAPKAVAKPSAAKPRTKTGATAN